MKRSLFIIAALTALTLNTASAAERGDKDDSTIGHAALDGAWWHGDLDPVEGAECKSVKNDSDGFAEAILCYGEEEAWTCASDDGAHWYCWAIDFRWETDCPTCGSPENPVRAVEAIIDATDPTAVLPTCGWRPSSLNNECDLVCNGDYKAKCVRTATGMVGCSTGEYGPGSGVTGHGTLPCEVPV